MNQSALLRPDWTPATVVLMVLGFMVFWPLGLAMLAYIMFGERFGQFKREANSRVDSLFSGFRRAGSGPQFRHNTGNVAFDEWRKAELERIEAERRKLDEMREEFDGYLRELRRAKDQEEFDRFMRDRASKRTEVQGYHEGSVPA